MWLFEYDGSHKLIGSGIIIRCNLVEEVYHSYLLPVLKRDTMTAATLTKERHLIGVAYVFIDLVHYHRGKIWWHEDRHGFVEYSFCKQ